MASSSLSSVVSDLMRASMGSSVPGSITDQDLDRHIGEIILREAKQKAERYKKDGIRAFLPATDSNAPRANKRFLTSIIRSTDDHNKEILRSQALAAAELKEAREEQARRERRARANEAAQDRLRRLMAGGRRDIGSDRWDPDRNRDRRHERRRREREKSRSRSPSRQRRRDEDEDDRGHRALRSSHRSSRDGGRRRSHRHRRERRDRSSSRSRSPRRKKERARHRSRSKSHSNKESDPELSQSDLRRSRSPQRRKKTVQASLSPTPADTCDEADESGTPHRHSLISRPRSSTRRDDAHAKEFVNAPSPAPNPSSARSSSPTPGPPSRSPSPPPILSKMDKYFSPTYDPRLDVAPLTSSSNMTIDVPATGLVDNAQFEGWDAMLELIRLRREDRAERKRLERMGLLPEKGKEGRGKKGKGMVSAGADASKGVMEIEYAKRGAIREWDMGKEVV